MIIFYSGSCGALKDRVLAGEPEVVFEEKSNVMLPYFLIVSGGQDQDLRFPLLAKQRKQNVPPTQS